MHSRGKFSLSLNLSNPNTPIQEGLPGGGGGGRGHGLSVPPGKAAPSVGGPTLRWADLSRRAHRGGGSGWRASLPTSVFGDVESVSWWECLHHSRRQTLRDTPPHLLECAAAPDAHPRNGNRIWCFPALLGSAQSDSAVHVTDSRNVGGGQAGEQSLLCLWTLRNMERGHPFDLDSLWHSVGALPFTGKPASFSATV